MPKKKQVKYFPNAFFFGHHAQNLYVPKTCIFQKEINHYNDGQYEGYTTDRQVRASSLSQQYTRLSMLQVQMILTFKFQKKGSKNNQKQRGD